jgi:FkbM family methyltransferase
MASAARGIRAIKKITGAEYATVVVIGTGAFQEYNQIKATWPMAKVVGADPQRPTTTRHAHVLAAVAASCGRTEMHGEGKRATLLAAIKPTRTEAITTVDTITLQQLHQRTSPWPRPALLRIDAEGAEFEIIRNGIPPEVDTVSLEVRWDTITNRAGQPTPWEIQRRMATMGYVARGLHSLTKDGAASEIVFRKM